MFAKKEAPPSELPEARGTQARGQDGRQHGGTHPAALGASGVCQSEALAHRHVPWRAQTAPQALSRRIHLPVEPPAAYPDGVRQPARPGHPPAARLSARLRRPAGLNNACHPMARRTLHAVNMVDRIAHAIAEADGGDFQADLARYRRLALAALQSLASPTEAMIDAAHQGGRVRRRLGHQQPQRLQARGEGDARRLGGQKGMIKPVDAAAWTTARRYQPVGPPEPTGGAFLPY